MRYLETKEQSSELLRLVLPLMARQSAALHPVSYTLWYEHVAGVNPTLSNVLSARLDANQPLSDDEAYELHARYIVSRDVERLQALQQRLRTLLDDTAQAAAAVGEDTGKFKLMLENSQSQLGSAQTSEGVRAVVAELVSEAARMQEATRSVVETLEVKTREVGELTEQLERARSEALIDPLTGLKNRRGFERAAADLLQNRTDLRGAALLVVDVDHFKHVNDVHGHLLGDKVLRAIGLTLQSNIKGRDVVGRLGGEEFAILLLQTVDKGAAALAEQIRAAIAGGRIRKPDGTELSGAITVSVGVAVATATESLETLMERADSALYTAKREGRNRVCVAR
jgi:diguanylate cyclase